MSGETSTTHADDASILHFLNNLFGSEFGLILQRDKFVCTVNALFPLVAFNRDIDSRLLVAAGIHHRIDFQHGAADRGEDRCGECLFHGLANLCAHFHLVALLHTRHCGSTDVLPHGEDRHFGQLCHLDWFSSREFVLCRMNTTYSKCFHNFIYNLPCTMYNFVIFHLPCDQ